MEYSLAKGFLRYALFGCIIEVIIIQFLSTKIGLKTSIRRHKGSKTIVEKRYHKEVLGLEDQRYQFQRTF